MNAAQNPFTIAVMDAKPGTGAQELALRLWLHSPGTGNVLVNLDPDGLSDRFLKSFSLHLIDSSSIFGADQAQVSNACLGCGSCVFLCRFGAIRRTSVITGGGKAHDTPWHVDPLNCTGCGVCARFCPSNAIFMRPSSVGTLQVLQRHDSAGTCVSAIMEPGREIDERVAARLIREGRNRKMQDAKLFVTGDFTMSPAAAAVSSAADIFIFAISPIPGMEEFLGEAARLAARAGRRACSVIISPEENQEQTRRLETYSRSAGMEPIGQVPFCVTTRIISPDSSSVLSLAAIKSVSDIINNII